MAKKDYPGLVIVPPSDRTILRRRVVRWSLFLIAVMWIASTVMEWPPTSHDDTDCQNTTNEDTPANWPEECDHSNQAPVTEKTREDDFRLTQISQAESLTEAPHPTPTPENNPPAPEFDRHENPTTKLSAPADPPADRTGMSSNDETPAPSVRATKATAHPIPDLQLAERGDAFAQYRLGRYYAKHSGRHAPESISWYKKASKGLRRLAEAGNGQAMYVLGVMYAYGRGVARNTEEAHRWLTQAVEQNVRAAQPVLANLEAKQTANPKPKDRGPAKSAKQQHSP
ncbi:MAG: sel1 repeat family protein [Nitrospira sp.]|nr:sel1 repeat family protein [Nitrospira sp.]MDH4368922.1 sel1 repeat family protein [Nitrospira sp.]MDH5346838.1 sel1 repeat family protein [Nitrospira sp.]MDH5496777.1 sel1 repeat family protein [Nitrospira sp.]MDH5724681.1 sel1 repeat family protein [Nitrospira sp.]